MFDTLPADLVVLILTFVARRWTVDPNEPVDWRGIVSLHTFSLVARRYRVLANDERLPLVHARRGHALVALVARAPRLPVAPGPTSLEQALVRYPNMLEPTRHGAHLHTGRVGFVGASTVLALLLDDEVVRWNLPLASQSADPTALPALEETIRRRVEEYVRRTDKSEVIKAQIWSLGEQTNASNEDIQAIIDANPEVIRARRATPVPLFAEILLQNRGGSMRPEARDGGSPWERAKLSYQQQTYQELIRSNHASYGELAKTDMEHDTYGHSEQLMMMSARWDEILMRLLDAAVRAVDQVLRDPGAPLRGWQVTLLLNRSPCTACARYLVVELTNFWRLLRKNLFLMVGGKEVDDAWCKEHFSPLFELTIAYSSLYKEKTDPTYPHAVIFAALQHAGWKLEAVPPLTKEQKKSGSCIDRLDLKPTSVDAGYLEQLVQAQERREAEDEYVPAGRKRKEQSPPAQQPPPRRSERPKKKVRYNDDEPEEGEEGEGGGS